MAAPPPRALGHKQARGSQPSGETPDAKRPVLAKDQGVGSSYGNSEEGSDDDERIERERGCGDLGGRSDDDLPLPSGKGGRAGKKAKGRNKG